MRHEMLFTIRSGKGKAKLIKGILQDAWSVGPKTGVSGCKMVVRRLALNVVGSAHRDFSFRRQKYLEVYLKGPTPKQIQAHC